VDILPEKEGVFLTKPEPSHSKTFWTPAFAGVTPQLTFYEFINFRKRILSFEIFNLPFAFCNSFQPFSKG